MNVMRTVEGGISNAKSVMRNVLKYSARPPALTLPPTTDTQLVLTKKCSLNKNEMQMTLIGSLMHREETRFIFNSRSAFYCLLLTFGVNVRKRRHGRLLILNDRA